MEEKRAGLTYEGASRIAKELGIEDGLLADGGANVNAIYDTSDKAFDPLVTAMSSQALVEVSKYNG